MCNRYYELERNCSKKRQTVMGKVRIGKRPKYMYTKDSYSTHRASFCLFLEKNVLHQYFVDKVP